MDEVGSIISVPCCENGSPPSSKRAGHGAHQGRPKETLGISSSRRLAIKCCARQSRCYNYHYNSPCCKLMPQNFSPNLALEESRKANCYYDSEEYTANCRKTATKRVKSRATSITRRPSDLSWRGRLPVWLAPLLLATLLSYCTSGLSTATDGLDGPPRRLANGRRLLRQVDANGLNQNRQQQQQQQQQEPPNDTINNLWRQQQRQMQMQLQQQQQQQQSSQQAGATTGATGWQLPKSIGMPYRTFHVTRACEWKSNLFVPKSNDILFAQNSDSQRDGGLSTSRGSSVVYETEPTGSSRFQGYLSSSSSSLGPPQHQTDTSVELGEGGNSRTMLSTSSRALVLALPVSLDHSFPGFEPACSIRLIVPRNMRILAKLTSRRLSFAAQEQLELDPNLVGSPPDFATTQGSGSVGSNFAFPTAGVPFSRFPQQQQQQQQHLSQRALWINVSQSQFTETEHRTIETEGNVLAFRFLLERFANKQLPDLRFQVVLTAFQTLSENSDLSSGGFQQPNQFGIAEGSQESQFICDQQRLIAANLACDGFKNCQDGHDEEPAACLAFRGQTGRPGLSLTGAEAPPTRTAGSAAGGGAVATSGGLWPRTGWQRLLAGLLLVLLLLACLAACVWASALLGLRRLIQGTWRRTNAKGARIGIGEASGAPRPSAVAPTASSRRQRLARLPAATADEIEALAAAQQNASNEARLAAAAATSGSLWPASKSGAGSLRRGVAAGPPAALQSILKRPSAGTTTPAPQADFRPTPARRLVRPARAPPPQPQPEPAAPAPRPPARPESRLNTKTGRDTRNSPTTTTRSPVAQRRELVSTYHLSSASVRLSESYIQRLAEQQASSPRAEGSPSSPSSQQEQPTASGRNFRTRLI